MKKIWKILNCGMTEYTFDTEEAAREKLARLEEAERRFTVTHYYYDLKEGTLADNAEEGYNLLVDRFGAEDLEILLKQWNFLGSREKAIFAMVDAFIR